MNVLLRLADQYLNDLIIILFGVVLFFLVLLAVIIYSEFRNLKNELMIPDDGENGALDTHRLAKIPVANERRAAYTKKTSLYNFVSQLIPLFPLLGILGTVAGLILNAQAGSDAEKMQEALGLALYSTYYGLIASILLKFLDTLLSNLVILPIEAVFDEYDTDYVLMGLRDQDKDKASGRYPENRGRSLPQRSEERNASGGASGKSTGSAVGSTARDVAEDDREGISQELTRFRKR